MQHLVSRTPGYYIPRVFGHRRNLDRDDLFVGKYKVMGVIINDGKSSRDD
ncbi:hypothetical protein WN51_13618 [Melipona quadrifasciata]|uniref:Uncharacterized protein n=1 Tax=Melipona quadrifasciata TaxID=166423 RepID=A0A0N0U5E7_9HYME|nr:hypothetical protein WN51_13618 [Melipona quadrifasciata]